MRTKLSLAVGATGILAIIGLLGWTASAQAPASAPASLVIEMIEESFNEPFKTGPLIDQQGNYAIFDILMNQSMFQYIQDNDLQSKVGQKSKKNAALKIDFPAGANKGQKARTTLRPGD